MKKIYTTLVAVFAIIHFSYAQWLPNGSDIYFNTGKVGIGTAVPTNLLHISGTTSGLLTGAYMQNVTAVTTASVALDFGIASSANLGLVTGRMANVQTGATSHDLVFSNYNGSLNERMRITSGGNIGIGTALPASLLDISGAGGGVLTLHRIDGSIGAGESAGMIQFYLHDSATTSNFSIANIEAQATQNIGADINPGRLIFRTTPSTVAAIPVERMRINEAGNVGIGTTIPAQPLAIAISNSGTSVADANMLNFYNSNATNGSLSGIWFGQASSSFNVQGAGIVGIQTNHSTGSRATDLAFYTTTDNLSGEKVRILGNGNVGIGTTSPDTRIDVLGAIATAPTIRIIGNDTGNYGLLQVGLSSAGIGARVVLGNVEAGGKRWDISSGGKTTGALSFENKTNSLIAMTILSTGNIGIGTTTPREALSVNGNIRSKQVKVELANWPDYVFKPTYDLPDLKDIENYIDKNQHLPDIPSEAEVTKDGLNLGEINKQLVKKVEELTLYLIEQNKNAKAQQDQINELKQQMTALTKALTQK